jgi:glycosyltransferase involved in cell wall biosynthesis
MRAGPPIVAVVVPCYRVSRQVLGVIGGIGPEVGRIFVVDDACPERSGDVVERGCSDPRVTVLRHAQNQGVGGAVVTGYEAALAAGADIVVKLDGDGQMDPARIPLLVHPLIAGEADYAKGNRFYDFALLDGMPRVRLFGNALLSLVNKVASGYWNVMDPSNGYTAIHRTALSMLPLERIDRGYFFESAMLFRLGTIRAVVRDVPLPARYANEASSLSIGRTLLQFPGKYVAAFAKRFFYGYFLRDFNVGTLQFVIGVLLCLGGGVFGAAKWAHSAVTGIPATSGEVMLAAFPTLVGIQLLLATLQFDVQNVPREPLSRRDARQDAPGAIGDAAGSAESRQTADHRSEGR